MNIKVCPECGSKDLHKLYADKDFGWECSMCRHVFYHPIETKSWPLSKSPERLAQEIIGRGRYEAETHLKRYGATEAQAAAAVSLVFDGRTVSGSLGEVTEAIQENCRGG